MEKVKKKLLESEELISNCCSAPFTYPGWPESDLCNKCYEHANIMEKEDG